MNFHKWKLFTNKVFNLESRCLSHAYEHILQNFNGHVCLHNLRSFRIQWMLRRWSNVEELTDDYWVHSIESLQKIWGHWYLVFIQRLWIQWLFGYIWWIQKWSKVFICYVSTVNILYIYRIEILICVGAPDSG